MSSDDVISIRGYGSINGNMTPLFVVNGSNVSQETFGQIIPNDIKSVTILKGPETARYGVRGSNGVIVITTK
ncbi:TonB-dependent receptor plug domain-containing protein [Polaribacter sp. MSW13]|uniref:TonB-dependent receptor plug domain-containing protein n=1 Tax=Polaribacter marinus TaxID=2916838 RepID=A0A9X2AMM3_9FLAO|nr:TonB-dependent receptor plug domain-containing protein [Polaribacter marinus]